MLSKCIYDSADSCETEERYKLFWVCLEGWRHKVKKMFTSKIVIIYIYIFLSKNTSSYWYVRKWVSILSIKGSPQQFRTSVLLLLCSGAKDSPALTLFICTWTSSKAIFTRLRKSCSLDFLGYSFLLIPWPPCFMNLDHLELG